MQQIELILLGKIIKVHGFQGAVMIALQGRISDEIKDMESLFVETDGKAVPFFIEWTREAGPESLLVKFDYYDSDHSIAEFVGCSVFTDRENLVELSDKQLPMYLRGYTLLDSNNRELGLINKIVSFPMQVMLEVRTKDTEELLVPYSKELIRDTDNDARTISMNLPEGIDTIND